MKRIRRIDRDSEAAEDIGTARIVARARKEIAAGAPLVPKHVVDRLVKQKRPIRAVRNSRTTKR
jgi:hypothetical protein